MQIKGNISRDVEAILKELFVACHRLESQIRDVKGREVQRALCRLYEDLSAVTAGIVNYVGLEKPSSQVFAVLMRTLTECCISVFAFCEDPALRADLYLNFPAVLDWQWVLLQEQHVGCPLIPDEPQYLAKMKARKKTAKANIARLGERYVKSKKNEAPAAALASALQDERSSARRFRGTWFPETRRNILASEGMEWAYDVWYVRLCSAVHSDAAASKLFPSLKRDDAIVDALRWWGAAVYRIVETFRFRLGAEHKRALHMDYDSLRR